MAPAVSLTRVPGHATPLLSTSSAFTWSLVTRRILSRCRKVPVCEVTRQKTTHLQTFFRDFSVRLTFLLPSHRETFQLPNAIQTQLPVKGTISCHVLWVSLQYLVSTDSTNGATASTSLLDFFQSHLGTGSRSRGLGLWLLPGSQ